MIDNSLQYNKMYAKITKNVILGIIGRYEVFPSDTVDLWITCGKSVLYLVDMCFYLQL